jgi:cyclic pyranopterin phosphate synthase
MNDTAAEDIEALRQFCFNRGFRIQFINHFSIDGEKRDDYEFDRPPACKNCNRIRLLPEGVLKPCLHSDDEIILDKNDIRGSLTETIRRKPEHGGTCSSRNMSEIGG